MIVVFSSLVLMGKRPHYLFILAFSIIAAFGALCVSARLTYQNAALNGLFAGVGRDGWIGSSAEITIKGVTSSFNKLTLEFNPFRPHGGGPAKFEVTICGAKPFEYSAGESTVLTLPLSECAGKIKILLKALNTFRANSRDTRDLSAKLAKIKLGSPLKLPIVRWDAVLPWSGAVFLLAYLVMGTVPRFKFEVGLFSTVLFALLLARAPFCAADQLFWLWVCVTTILVGVRVAKNSPSTPSMIKNPLPTGWTYGIAILVITALGGIIRGYGIDFGLPYRYHPDEFRKVLAITTMMVHHNLDPNYFLHPTFLIYCTYCVTKILGIIGIPDGMRFPELAFLSGRIVSAVAGTLSIPLIYLVGRNLYSRFSGLTAALLLAVFPLHVTSSRYLKEDSLLVFLVLAGIVAMLHSVRNDKPKWLFIASFLFGLSASTKYSGALNVVLLCAAPWLRSRSFIPDRVYIRHLIFSLPLFPIAFFVGTPFALLNSHKFMTDFFFEKEHMLRGHTQSIDAWSQYWMYHFSYSLIPGISLTTTLISLFGLGILLWRRRIDDLFVVALIFLFYLPAEWVKAKPAPQPERYIFPCLPFLALATSEAIRFLHETQRRLVAWSLLFVAFIFPAGRTLALAQEIKPDTRAQAAKWMVENLPPHSRVLMDWSPYAPDAPPGHFNLTYVMRANVMRDFLLPKLQTGGGYLVLSSLFYERYFSQPNGNRTAASRFRDIFTHVRIIKEFSTRQGTYGFHNPRITIFSLNSEDFKKIDEELQKKSLGEIMQTSNEREFGTVLDRCGISHWGAARTCVH